MDGIGRAARACLGTMGFIHPRLACSGTFSLSYTGFPTWSSIIFSHSAFSPSPFFPHTHPSPSHQLAPSKWSEEPCFLAAWAW